MQHNCWQKAQAVEMHLVLLLQILSMDFMDLWNNIKNLHSCMLLVLATHVATDLGNV